MDPRQQLLSQLHDVVTPSVPGYWPLAPLWWVLIIATISAAAAGVYFLIRYRTKNAYKKYAANVFNDLDKAATTPQDKAHNIIALLKRTYFSAYPNERKEHAGLHGLAWLECLNSKQIPKFDLSALTNSLDNLLYAPENTDQSVKNSHQESHQETLTTLEKFAKHWLRHHKRSLSNNGSKKITREAQHVHV